MKTVIISIVLVALSLVTTSCGDDMTPLSNYSGCTIVNISTPQASGKKDMMKVTIIVPSHEGKVNMAPNHRKYITIYCYKVELDGYSKGSIIK